jgi:hypothetical protein
VFGNRCDRLVAPAGELVICSEIVAEVTPDVAAEAHAPRTRFRKLPPEALHFTLPSRYCPADKLRALGLEVTRGCAHGYAEVQANQRLRARAAHVPALETLQVRAGVAEISRTSRSRSAGASTSLRGWSWATCTAASRWTCTHGSRHTSAATGTPSLRGTCSAEHASRCAGGRVSARCLRVRGDRCIWPARRSRSARAPRRGNRAARKARAPGSTRRRS